MVDRVLRFYAGINFHNPISLLEPSSTIPDKNASRQVSCSHWPSLWEALAMLLAFVTFDIVSI